MYVSNKKRNKVAFNLLKFHYAMRKKKSTIYCYKTL